MNLEDTTLNEPITKGQIVYDSTLCIFQSGHSHRDRKLDADHQGLGEEGMEKISFKGERVPFGKDEKAGGYGCT